MIAGFVLCLLFLVFGPIAGCNGYEWGEDHGARKMQRSGEWKKTKARAKAFEAELADIRRNQAAVNEDRQAARNAAFRTWENTTRAAYADEFSSIEARIADLRNRMSTRPVEEAKAPDATKELSDADFLKRLERWANKERKSEWKKYVRHADSAKKYRSSIAAMERRAKTSGTRPEDEPGFEKASRLCKETESAARTALAELKTAYAGAVVGQAVEHVSRLFAESAREKSVSVRIDSLDARLRNQISDTEAHLRQ